MGTGESWSETGSEAMAGWGGRLLCELWCVIGRNEQIKNFLYSGNLVIWDSINGVLVNLVTEFLFLFFIFRNNRTSHRIFIEIFNFYFILFYIWPSQILRACLEKYYKSIFFFFLLLCTIFINLTIFYFFQIKIYFTTFLTTNF